MKLKNIISLFMALGTIVSPLYADKLVILHTNDSHSQIDPADNGLGGVVRRKTLIDSVRSANDNVLLIDAGDAVQGTLFFTIYKGEVEYRLLDELGYDMAILGNHDFDNGKEELAEHLSESQTTWLSANYDMKEVPGLDSVFIPNVIKEYAGKKVGIMGINLVPEGMISKSNYEGVVYLDAYDVANATAKQLRENGADYVIAVTHIGYDTAVEPNDCLLAKKTTGIDLIIGGHSHSIVEPSAPMTERFHWKHLNAEGDTVGVVQAGARGAYVGEVTLDLDNGNLDYRLITVDARLDSNADSALTAIIERYRDAVDSIMNVNVGVAARKLSKDDPGLMNFLGDFVAWKGEKLAGKKIDASIMNAGGVRRDIPEGNISKGVVIDMLPFNNKIVVLEIKGDDLLEAIDNVVKRGGFDGVKNGVDITFNPDTKTCVSALIDGNPVDPSETYLLATIDYLANGGDYMSSLPRALQIAASANVLYDDLIEYILTQWDAVPVDGSVEPRITKTK